ncbi:MAG: serine hydrolase, partial [Spirochaetia bacterium]|nr:serine hydrolase [Spirochaetia bacterium]
MAGARPERNSKAKKRVDGVNPAWRPIAIGASALCIAALGYIGIVHFRQRTPSNGLLSPRVYSGILPQGKPLLFNYGPLEERLHALIDAKKKGRCGVFVQNLRDGAFVGIHENDTFEPASLNKLPMAMVVLHRVEQGRLNLDTRLTVTKDDFDGHSGTQQLEVGADYEVRELLHAMLSDSDNTSFRVFKRVIDLDELAYLS